MSAYVGCDGIKCLVAASVSSELKRPDDFNGYGLFPRLFLHRGGFGAERIQEADDLDGYGLFFRSFLHVGFWHRYDEERACGQALDDRQIWFSVGGDHSVIEQCRVENSVVKNELVNNLESIAK